MIFSLIWASLPLLDYNTTLDCFHTVNSQPAAIAKAETVEKAQIYISALFKSSQIRNWNNFNVQKLGDHLLSRYFFDESAKHVIVEHTWKNQNYQTILAGIDKIDNLLNNKQRLEEGLTSLVNCYEGAKDRELFSQKDVLTQSRENFEKTKEKIKRNEEVHFLGNAGVFYMLQKKSNVDGKTYHLVGNNKDMKVQPTTEFNEQDFFPDGIAAFLNKKAKDNRNWKPSLPVSTSNPLDPDIQILNDLMSRPMPGFGDSQNCTRTEVFRRDNPFVTEKRTYWERTTTTSTHSSGCNTNNRFVNIFLPIYTTS